MTYLTLHTLAANRVDEVPTEISELTMQWWQTVLDKGRSTGEFKEVSVAECMALLGGMTSFYLSMHASQTAILSEIGSVEWQRVRINLQQLMKTLVLRDPPHDEAER